MKTKLKFEFNIDEDFPDVNYEVPLKTKDQKNNKINIEKKKNGRDSSTNKLF